MRLVEAILNCKTQESDESPSKRDAAPSHERNKAMLKLKLKKKKIAKPEKKEGEKRKRVDVSKLDFNFGNNPNYKRRKTSIWDQYKDRFKKPGDWMLGFLTAQQAAQCATRLRKVFDLPVESYTDQETGKFGVIWTPENAGQDEEE